MFVPKSDEKKYDVVIQWNKGFDDILVLWEAVDWDTAVKLAPLFQINRGNLYVVESRKSQKEKTQAKAQTKAKT